MFDRDGVLSRRVVLILATHWQRAVFLALLCSIAAIAQEPVINPQGVVNAASFAGAGIASGGIASLFGRNLAPATHLAEATPLPRSLEGTSVTVGGIAAPLFYVSPSQINFQVPSMPFLVAEQVPVVVTTAAGTSAPVLVDLVYANIGIFTQDARGCGPGAVLNVAAGGSVRLNTPAESASPGNFVSVYATGLGPVTFAPADGEPASSDPLSRGWSGAGVRLGPEGFAKRVLSLTSFSGRAPGLVGADQVNFQIPDDAPEGCAVPL